MTQDPRLTRFAKPQIAEQPFASPRMARNEKHALGKRFNLMRRRCSTAVAAFEQRTVLCMADILSVKQATVNTYRDGARSCESPNARPYRSTSEDREHLGR